MSNLTITSDVDNAMATKNMARSMVEGGHSKSYNRLVRKTIRCARHKNRTLCKKLSHEVDPSFIEFHSQTPRYWGEHSDHSNRLVRKMLRTKIGESWDLVYSKYSERFPSMSYGDRHLRRNLAWELDWMKYNLSEFTLDNEGRIQLATR